MSTSSSEPLPTQPSLERKAKPAWEELDYSDVEWIAAPSSEDDDPAQGYVEIAFVDDEWVVMRKSSQREGPYLVFDHPEWNAFVEGAKDGEFDDFDDEEEDD